MDESCLQTIVDDLGPRAFRRSLDADTRQGLLDYASGVAANADTSTQAMEPLLLRLLTSSNFLYRTEIGTPLPEHSPARPLGPVRDRIVPFPRCANR